jgi:hypothetical protein
MVEKLRNILGAGSRTLAMQSKKDLAGHPQRTEIKV